MTDLRTLQSHWDAGSARDRFAALKALVRSQPSSEWLAGASAMTALCALLWVAAVVTS